MSKMSHAYERAEKKFPQEEKMGLPKMRKSGDGDTQEEEKEAYY